MDAVVAGSRLRQHAVRYSFADDLYFIQSIRKEKRWTRAQVVLVLLRFVPLMMLLAVGDGQL